MSIAFTVNSADISEKEKLAYADYLQKKHNRKLESLDIQIDGDFVDLHYKFEPVGFERIRRITGYLSEVRQFNDGKKGELRDRVKHT